MSYDASISASGRYVAFTSQAINLVSGDTNLAEDVFVHDRAAGRTERVSVRSDSGQGLPDEQSVLNGWYLAHSYFPSISANGRYISFTSAAGNLVAGDTNGQPDVFVHDRKTGHTERISVTSEGEQSAMSCGPADGPECSLAGLPWLPRSSISGNGRFVAFDTEAPDLVELDTNGQVDVFVHDRKTGHTERISVTSSGDEGRDSHQCPWCSLRHRGSSLGGIEWIDANRNISFNGRHVAFVSSATNLVPNDTNNNSTIQPEPDLFVHDRRTGRVERVNVSSSGAQEPESLAEGGHYPSMSSNGRFVVWNGTNPEPPDHDDGFLRGFYGLLHDRVTGALESGVGWGPESWMPPGEPSPDTCCANDLTIADISSDGRYMGFSTVGTQGDRFPVDFYLRDRGSVLGVSGFGESPPKQAPPDDRICIEGVCIPPGAAVSSSDDTDDVDDVLTGQGENLYGASLAYRPQYEDLFAAIELEHMPQILPGASPIFYGLRFKVEGKGYEMRATSLNFGTFELFDCTGTRPACTKVAELKGGYGTTGMRVVFSLPLDAIGLENGGELRDVEAFSGLGSYLTGATKVLDSVKLK